MAKCSFCNQRKAKRSCPALGAGICPRCCGEEQGAAIECPSDCSWRKGLRLVEGGAGLSADAIKGGYASALEKLDRWAAKTGRLDELIEAGGMPELEEEPAEWALPVLMALFWYGVTDPEGKTTLERFLAERGHLLSTAEAAALVALRGARASIYRVATVRRGLGLVLDDLIGEEPVEVRELSASSSLSRGDVLAAWVFKVADRWELTGALLHIPAFHEDVVVDEVGRFMESLDEESEPPVGLERSGLLMRWATESLIEAIQTPPTIVGPDGGALLHSEATYDVLDAGRVREAIEGASWLEEEDEQDEWVWLEPAGESADMYRPRAWLSLEGDRFRLSAFSKEGLAHARERVEALLGEGVRHRADSYRDVTSAAHDADEIGGAGRGATSGMELDELPDEIRAAVTSTLEAHYASWPDEKLPALGGRTAREVAAEGPAGRERVGRLVDKMEMGPGPAVDLTEMRLELGLPVRPSAELEEDYDPSKPPPPNWLDCDEGDRIAAVVEFHQNEGSSDLELNRLRLHAMIHVVVENQVAASDPPATAFTIERLKGEGLSRHEAVHAVGAVVLAALQEALQTREAVDVDALASALARIDAAPYRGSAPDLK